MNKYLNNNINKNTTSDNLWESFDKIETNTILNTKDMMSSWVSQMGFPLVKVVKRNNLLFLSQRQYFNNINETNTKLWSIPIKIKNNKGESRLIYLTEKEQTYDLKDFDFNLLNSDRTVFMRVQYELLPNITNISINDIIGLIDDIFVLSINNYQSFEQFFTLIDKLNLTNETNFYIWNILLEKINIIYDNIVIYDNKQYNFKQRIIKPITKILINILNKMNKKLNELNINDTQLRILIMEYLVKQKNKSIINKSIVLFRHNNFKVYPTEIILYTIGKYGFKKDYQQLFDIFKKEHDPHIIDQILYSFGQVCRPELLKYSLELSLSNLVRTQDLIKYISYLSSNKYLTNTLWFFVVNNWEKFIKLFPYDSAYFKNFAQSIASGFNNREQLNTYTKFFKNKPKNTGVIQTIEIIEDRINHKKIINAIL